MLYLNRSGIKVMTKGVIVGRTSCHIALWRCVGSVLVDVDIDVCLTDAETK